MDDNAINWCACEGHDHRDWTVVADFYARHFIPHGWALEYHTLDQEQGRILYMIGTCNHCGGFMRSGAGIAMNISGDRFLADVYQGMRRRAYDGHDCISGTYHSCVKQRARWYQQQDDLTLENHNMQFLRLFHSEDQAVVKDWLGRNHAKETHNGPRRDRKSTLLRQILELARADGAIAAAEAILDDIPPNVAELVRPEEDSYLTNYCFEVVPHLKFGREGIYLDLFLEGLFDDTIDRETTIGRLKTLRRDVEACQLMGALGGVLMHYGHQYVNREIYRYTPERELARQPAQQEGAV